MVDEVYTDKFMIWKQINHLHKKYINLTIFNSKISEIWKKYDLTNIISAKLIASREKNTPENKQGVNFHVHCFLKIYWCIYKNVITIIKLYILTNL